MAGERLERSEVGERGLWGDRGWAEQSAKDDLFQELQSPHGP